MREAKSYSIVDHALLHGGFLGKLPHAALALYLFLVVVGDREGRSFYSDASVGAILRLFGQALDDARRGLISAGLVRYRRPYWWVEGLTRAGSPAPPARQIEPAIAWCAGDSSAGRQDRIPRLSLAPARGIVPEALRALIRTLEARS